MSHAVTRSDTPFAGTKRSRNNAHVSACATSAAPTIPIVNDTMRSASSPRSAPSHAHRRSTRRQAILLTAGLFAGLAFAGCADSAPSTGASRTSGTNPVAAGVPAALNFRASLVGGGTFDGATLARRTVVFWFWAPT